MKQNISPKSILISLGTSIGILLLIFGVIYFSTKSKPQNLNIYIDEAHDTNPPNQKEISKFYSLRAASSQSINDTKKAKDSFYIYTIGSLLLASPSSNAFYIYQAFDSSNYEMMKKIPTQYIGLPWLTLKNDNDFYFSENGKHFILPMTKIKDKNGSELYKKYDKIQVNFAIKKDLSNGSSKNQFDKDQILMQLNPKYSQLWRIFAIASMALFILSFITLFINSLIIIWKISKGRPFISSNIRRLKTCLLFSLLPLLINILSIIIIYVIVYDDIKTFIKFNFIGVNTDFTIYLLPTVYAFLLIAFSKGYKLQQDQEFTI